MEEDYGCECSTCGLLFEVAVAEIDTETPIVTCPKCESVWLMEVHLGEPWLEPVREIC